ncbi:MAG TPA: hypothetical protein VJN39_10530 [Gemmatimonadales bacterium]|nr:hypothetical protein [Gemmatimonadales bacterium]
MIALTATRNRCTRRLAALLLVLQGLAGGVVPLAHASERLTAPAHIEAQHGAGCLALHDSFRCALCQLAGSQVTTQQVRAQPRAAATVEARFQQYDAPPARRPAQRTAPPRAPPLSRSW